MKNFWNGFAKIAAQVALWAASHPEIVQAVITASAQK